LRAVQGFRLPLELAMHAIMVTAALAGHLVVFRALRGAHR